MKYFFGTLILVLGFVYFLVEDSNSHSNRQYPVTDYHTVFNVNTAWTNERLSNMTLREKIAQMIISHSKGFTLEKDSEEYLRLKNAVKNEKVGGIIFFAGNSVQEAGLINELQSLSETPLLISADFERGTKMRLEDGSLFPNNMGIGATRNPDLAYKMGFEIARECRAIGVHQNYAPVLDVNNNAKNPIINVRSFGESPELVSQMGDMMIKGLQDGNVIATGKHFPGHGDTDIDSHSDLPILNFGKERLEKTELVPFKSAINNGVMSIMTAHLSFPALDSEPNVPASLSHTIITDLLIEKLNFKGLIVTDALNMKGVTKHFTTKEVALMCVNAGIDLILMPQGEEETIDVIEEAVNNGSITEERIDISVTKILNAKNWLGLNENKIVDTDNIPNVINSPKAQETSQLIADESITLVTDRDDIFPFKNVKDKKCLVVSVNNGLENANTSLFIQNFKDYEKNSFHSVSYHEVMGEVQNAKEILDDAENYDVIIIPVYAKVKIFTGTVGLPESQLELINSLLALGKDLAVISFGNPYLIQGFPDASTYVCAYGDAPSSLNATIKAMHGDIGFKGKLPVSISDVYTYGTGITK